MAINCSICDHGDQGGVYQVTKNWMGDPCVPKTMAWDRLACSYAIGSRPRITRV